MLTDEELRNAYFQTNKLKHSEGWLGLERFAREIERLVQAKYKLPEPNHGRNCASCGRWKKLSGLVIRDQQWFCKPTCSDR